jgi:hypothetical protein
MRFITHRTGLREPALIATACLVASVIYYALSHIAYETLGLPYQRGMHEPIYSTIAFTPTYLMIFIIWLSYTYLRHHRTAPFKHFFKTHIDAVFFSPKSLICIACLLMSHVFFITGYMSFKVIIQEFAPFHLDATLHQLDQWLHFGYLPWQILHPLLSHPTASLAIFALYMLWFWVVLCFLLIAFLRFHHDAASRRFVLSYFSAIFLCGTLLAVACSSAGPVYFERLGYGSDYAALLEYLASLEAINRVNIASIHEMLWLKYTQPVLNVPASGISAMPSLHVLFSVLCALYASTIHPWLGKVLWVNAGLILVGSVHLAWHYALDGYASIALALFLWRAWRGSETALKAPIK